MKPSCGVNMSHQSLNEYGSPMPLEMEGFIGDFRRKARLNPDCLFARFDGQPLLFGTLDDASETVAEGLRRMGLESGDRVAVMMRNSPNALAVIYGLAKAGIIWVPLNAQLRGDGLRYILEHCEPGAIICDEDLQQTIRDSGAALTGIPLVISSCSSPSLNLDDMFEARGSAVDRTTTPDPLDLFAIMYTSGTTGRPKGVEVSHSMIRLAADAVAQLSEAAPKDVFFVWEPFYHVGGAQVLILPIIRDVSLAMVDRFSASRFWSQVRDYEATHIHYLGGILQILLKQPESRDDSSNPVRIAWGGGCPKEIWTQFEDRFGVSIRECYGMTEASSITTCNTNGVVGSVGRPMPWFSVQVLDVAAAEVSPGEKGEIVVRTDRNGAIFKGYYRNPDATASALRDGALRTGDLGSFDEDGNLFFHGRMTDSVRCKGENVSAWEVEHVAAEYPLIEECAMIGVAAEIGEQDIKLFVKPKAGVTVDPSELSAWLSLRLAPFQNPRYIAVIDTFEYTPSHRIMKHRLARDTENCFDRLSRGGLSHGILLSP